MKKILFILLLVPFISFGQHNQKHYYIKNGLYWDNAFRPFNPYSTPELNDLDSMANNGGISVYDSTSNYWLESMNSYLADIDDGTIPLIKLNTDTIKFLLQKYDVLLDVVNISAAGNFTFGANVIILAAFNGTSLAALNTTQITALTGLTDIDRQYLIGNMLKAPGTYPQQFNGSNALTSRNVVNGNSFKVNIVFAKIN